MTELHDTPTIAGPSRRNVAKAAAWTVPAVAVAVGAPLAAASIGNATVEWTGTSLQLLSIGLLSGSGTVSLGVLSTFPRDITVQNGSGVLPGPLTGSISVSYTAGLAIPVTLSAITFRGFAPKSIPGVTLGTTTITKRKIGDALPTGADVSVFDTVTPFTITDPSIASGVAKILGDVVWGATAKEGTTVVTLSALTSYTATVSVSSNSTLVGTDTGTLSFPIGASLL